MSKIKDENYFVVSGWMLNRLQLKGNELIVYAIIYGFSQTENQWFTGSRKYLSEFAGCSINTVDNCLSSLLGKGLIQKQEYIHNGVKFCHFTANCDTAPKNGAPPPQKLGHPPAPKIGDNNKEIHIELDNNTPLYPPQHEDQKTDDKKQIVAELKRRINALFHRRESTTWAVNEERRLHEISRRNDVLSECTEIEALYNSDYPYRRRDIATFLNNWSTELDRARNRVDDRNNGPQPQYKSKFDDPMYWKTRATHPGDEDAGKEFTGGF